MRRNSCEQIQNGTRKPHKKREENESKLADKLSLYTNFHIVRTRDFGHTKNRTRVEMMVRNIFGDDGGDGNVWRKRNRDGIIAPKYSFCANSIYM